MEYLAESAMMTGNENITLTKFAAGSKILHVLIQDGGCRKPEEKVLVFHFHSNFPLAFFEPPRLICVIVMMW